MKGWLLKNRKKTYKIEFSENQLNLKFKNRKQTQSKGRKEVQDSVSIVKGLQVSSSNWSSRHVYDINPPKTTSSFIFPETGSKIHLRSSSLGWLPLSSSQRKEPLFERRKVELPNVTKRDYKIPKISSISHLPHYIRLVNRPKFTGSIFDTIPGGIKSAAETPRITSKPTEYINLFTNEFIKDKVSKESVREKRFTTIQVD